MNLISRSVTKVLSSSLYQPRTAKLPTRNWVSSRKFSSGGESEAPEKEVAPPNTIKLEEEVENSVNLIGVVDQPVQFDGNWAGTIISQQSFGVPILFKGDLAKTAAQRIKKDDIIHVSGKLFQNEAFRKFNLQVVAQTFNFIQDIPPDMKISQPETEESSSTEKKPAKKKKVRMVDEETSNLWKHLLSKPKEWLDHRGNKANGLVKPRHPDFKHKSDGTSLWLGAAPGCVLPILQGLEFDVAVPKQKTAMAQSFNLVQDMTINVDVTVRQPNDESWNDLAQNRHKWWDNRSHKTNPKVPDFKHMETGETLWMRDAPTWVQSKLPPLKKKDEKPATD